MADVSEHLLRRAAALFGLYIWYMTQPKNTEVNIPVAEYILIPIGEPKKKPSEITNILIGDSLQIHTK